MPEQTDPAVIEMTEALVSGEGSIHLVHTFTHGIGLQVKRKSKKIGPLLLHNEGETVADTLATLAALVTGKPVLEVKPNHFPKSKDWKPGERVEYVTRAGEPNVPGTVVRVEDYLIAADRLYVQFDDEDEPKAINSDVMRHIREPEDA